MSRFNFIQKKGIFKWESDFLSLEFSNPSIQAFSEFTKISKISEIMYYYYQVKIYKKVDRYNFNKNTSYIQKELVSSRYTHDFPCILELQCILESLIKDEVIHGGQKNKYSDGTIKYSKTLFTEGFACDDFYEITKFVDKKNNNSKYIVYMGTTFDSQGDLNSSGIRTPYVSEEDIQELLKCVNAFIKYSMDENNKAVENYKKTFKIKGNKIYEYVMEKNKVNYSKIESIFAIGDKLNIITVVNNIQEEYEDIVSDIKDDKVYLNNKTINLKDIVYINIDVPDEKLKYNLDKITKDFISILSEDEKEEFRQELINVLLSKYKMAIIDRTSMCRNEHNFDIDYHTEDNIKAVTPIVKKIIEKIKKIV